MPTQEISKACLPVCLGGCGQSLLAKGDQLNVLAWEAWMGVEGKRMAPGVLCSPSDRQSSHHHDNAQGEQPRRD